MLNNKAKFLKCKENRYKSDKISLLSPDISVNSLIRIRYNCKVLI